MLSRDAIQTQLDGLLAQQAEANAQLHRLDGALQVTRHLLAKCEEAAKAKSLAIADKISEAAATGHGPRKPLTETTL